MVNKQLIAAALGVYVICIIIVLNFWMTNTYTYTNQDHHTGWFRVQFHAASNAHDISATFRGGNVSAFDSDKTCTIPRFDDDSEPPSYVTCKRIKPYRSSCDTANKLYHSESTPTCNHQKSYDICRIQSNGNSHLVNCSNNICVKNIYLGTINRTDGHMQWKTQINLASLEDSIRNIIDKHKDTENYGFCYVQCTLKDETNASQLLLVPKNFSHITCNEGSDCRDSININVIWLDSTSHSHFYRSLPKSVEALREIKSNQDAYLFSYNLMQAMHGATIVNTVALTSGKVEDRKYLIKKSIPIGNLFDMFKRKGHHTTWIDDLCWTWSMGGCPCGIPKFVGMPTYRKNDTTGVWKLMQQKLLEKGVDNIGISLANCEIMKANNIWNPLKGQYDHTAICYNGQYQPDYILSYIEMLQTQLNLVRRPSFKWLDLNTAHEATGRRIQTLDGSFAKFIKFLSRQKNTFTLIFGDHGVTYGTFVQQTTESKIEMSHPVLFALVSNDLKEKLGVDKMRALEINQDRLVNILDLRHTLLTLVPGISKKSLAVDKKFDTHPNGLFYPIDPKRSCKSMGIAPMFGKCICAEGRINYGLQNNTKVVTMADFAMGQINNKIQKAFMKTKESKTKKIGFGFCQRLVGKWISEVQETVIENITITEMNIHISPGTNAPQSSDEFRVVIHESSPTSDIKKKTLMTLTHYQRISTFAVYDKCKDPIIDGTLCVCSLSEKTDETQMTKYWHQIPHIVFDHPSTVLSLNDCLFLYERRTHFGLVLEASCDCRNKTFQLKVAIVDQVNVVYSQLPPITTDIRSGMMSFVAAFHQHDPMQSWILDYDVQFKEK
ncbi:uncharacterized protein [Amphiura filiformis]|uniref:uncharacterized protein n=1 Tax=Amphiura filiformis TaxID=82378 RepID=UPI003B216D94